jgi:uncharacterized oxidoreductase
VSQNEGAPSPQSPLNLLAPIRLTAALLPLLQKHPRSTIMNVSSGLAFVPMAPTPTYCATKAAIHSDTQSLRYQLRDSAIEALEFITPYVAADLMSGGASDPRAIPLDKFIAEVMEIPLYSFPIHLASPKNHCHPPPSAW